jgi:hypothetical protein
MWDKPKRVRDSSDQYTFDGGPIGGYVPNMSDEDRSKWKGTVVGKTLKKPQIELRKTFSATCGRWGNAASVLIIVSLGDGYKYKHLEREDTKGINIHFSTNSAILTTFEGMQEVATVIEEAKNYLVSMALAECE